jgi:hypothetical protein
MTYTHKLARRLARLRPAAVLAACGRWSSDRKIGHNRAVQHHLVCRTLPILTLVLLLAACADSSAPAAPDAGAVDMYQVGRGWARRLVGIRISPDTAVVSPGQTIAFKASGVLSDSSSRPITVAWAATGGTIDSAGLFTAGSSTGTYHVVGAQLTLGLADTAAVVDTTVSVDAPAPAVASVSVSPSSSSLLVGGSVQLAATARDSSGATLSGIAFTWASSASTVATVSSGGLVTGQAAGTVTVTATVQSVSGKATVAVMAPAVAAGCLETGYSRLVNVSTPTDLTNAINAALPGDQIRLAAGTYTGFRTITRSGTAANPITLCGPSTANIGGTGTTTGGINLNVKASYWNLYGFTMQTTFTPLWLMGATHVIVQGLEIYNVGQQAIAIQQFSTNNLIDANYIHDTGKTTAQYGEGVYVGTDAPHWVNGVPDRTDNNTVSNNTIGPNIGSEPIQTITGTTGTIITGNHIDRAGRGYAGSGASIFVVGNSAIVNSNVITNVSGTDNGVYVETTWSGWGQNNSFANNTITGSGVSGYGFLVGNSSKATTTIRCNNVVSGFSSGFANTACTQ